MEGSKDSSYPSQESPWGLALTLTLLQGRQCPLLPSHPSRAQGQQKAHLLLLRGTETQWGPKAACPVPPWPSCTLPVQRQPTFPLTFPLFPALRRRANISVTFAGSPPGPSNTHSSHPPCSPATEAHEFPCHWQSLRASYAAGLDCVRGCCYGNIYVLTVFGVLTNSIQHVCLLYSCWWKKKTSFPLQCLLWKEKKKERNY